MTAHLELEQAVDFVRGLSSAAASARVARHLETPCDRCRATVAWAQRIAHTAQADLGLDAPADVVRRAVALFPVRARNTASWPERLTARLVFDSHFDPLPVGIRAGHHASRHVLYRARGYYVDLRLDYEAGQRRVSLVGQIAEPESDRTGATLASMVLLTDRGKVLARSDVSAFGEFQVEYRPAPRLRLQIPLDPGPSRIEIPLSRLDPLSH
jgi:hypothetical protein